MDSTSRNVGSVRAGETASLAFPLRNTGDAPLRIQSVTGDCGCLVPRYPSTVPPRGKAAIDVRFEPQAHWGGKIEKSLVVRTNDPSQPELKLVVTSDVVPFVKMEPTSPLQVLYRPGQVYKRELKLTPRRGSRLGLSNPVSRSPEVKAKLVPPSAADPTRTYRLQLTIGPRKTPGDFTSNVELTSTEPKLPIVSVVVVGLAEKGPVTTPSQVFLPSVSRGPAGQELSRIQVFARTGGLKVLSASTGNPGIVAEVEVKNPGHFYEVVLKRTPRLKPGNVETVIQVKTDDRAHPVLKVPFYATVQ